LTDIKTYDYDVPMFEDPAIDAVYIAIPTGLHLGAVIAAAKAKKAILCEKPMGNNAEEVRAMVQASKDNNVPLMTDYMARFSDVFQKAKEMIQGGDIGQVSFVTTHFSYPCMDPYPPGKPDGWRWTDPAGGGPLLDIGIYLAFGIREILGERLAQVTPLNMNTTVPPEAAVPDTTAAVFVTDKGTPGTLVTTFSHSALYMTFFGATGNLIVKDNFYQTSGAVLQLERNREVVDVLNTKLDPNLSHCDNYRREFEHFSNALLTNTPHSPSAEDVLADALLLDALKKNATPIVAPTPAQYLQA